MARTHPRNVWWRWRRNPLRRRCDVIEAWTALFLGTLLFLASPLTGALVAAHAHRIATAASAQQRSLAHTILAVLTEDAPAASTGGLSGRAGHPVLARWTGADGRTHTALTKVAAGSRTGSTVRVWVDRHDTPTSAPQSTATIWLDTIGTGAATTAVAGVVVSGVWLAFGAVAQRRRMAEWEREWILTGPQWTRGRH